MEYTMNLHDVEVTANEEISEREALAYIERARKNNPGKVVTSMKLNFEGEDVSIETRFAPIGFEKIRRITGYLVGDMSHWNDAKTAEERDRVKHG